VKNSFDVCIVGAGVVGAAIARELSRYRIRTALLEKEVDVSFGTSKANSGIIHAGFHAPPGTLKAELCVKGSRVFDHLSEELEFPFERRGELVVAFNDEELRVLQTLYRTGRQNRVQYLEILGRERTLELEPELSPDVQGALYAPTAGIIGPYEFCFALVENAAANGVRLFLGQKLTWIAPKERSGFQVETAAGLNLESRFVVNAAGLHADEVAAFLGLHDFKITPRKGEEYLLDRRVGGLVRRVIFPVPGATSKGMLVIPTVDGPVMVGPTAEDTEDKEDFSTSREGLRRVFEHAQKMVPAIRTRDIITSFSGLRPAASGGDFIIGPTRIPGFINAAGIQSPGLTASPAIAERVRDCLLAQGLRLEVKPDFNPRRPAFPRIRELVEARRFEEVAELAAKDPGYGKIVCRCENITEAEVTAAIRRGHTTLDSLKFATRVGTGRCQGGFCTYRLLNILKREAGLDYTAISKKGPGSEILDHRLNKGGQK
jgi:glycerol-3-phosphate dehydrogenase